MASACNVHPYAEAGFAISIAALGLTLGAVDAAAEFAQPFVLAALVALLGMIAALVLLPAKSDALLGRHN